MLNVRIVSDFSFFPGGLIFILVLVLFDLLAMAALCTIPIMKKQIN